MIGYFGWNSTDVSWSKWTGKSELDLLYPGEDDHFDHPRGVILSPSITSAQDFIDVDGNHLTAEALSSFSPISTRQSRSGLNRRNRRAGEVNRKTDQIRAAWAVGD